MVQPVERVQSAAERRHPVDDARMPTGRVTRSASFLAARLGHLFQALGERVGDR